MKDLFTFLLGSLCLFFQAEAQTGVWVSDLGNGNFKNPIIHADYSDPDAIRVGDVFYMTASSFNASPGLPLLQSKDLVNWTLVGHALHRQPPYDHFSKVQHGGGVWAPSIRFHNNEFYIYYPDPDFGIYMIKARQFAGPWTDPVLVEGGQGLIDPCPLWDDNGKAWLAYAFAGSRAGIKSILCVKPLLPDGTKTFGQPVMVFDGHKQDPTVEGPKLYKRNGWYYIFAPAGGVSTGWQLALRSKSIYGPYERKVVMHQGSSSINGPHQGAWVDTKMGEHWFLHFQDKEAYGRVVHLQPMVWKNDWPVIGEDADGDGTGEPVLSYRKPTVAIKSAVSAPPDSDEFNLPALGPQWQWQANPRGGWAFPTSEGYLRMFSVLNTDSSKHLWNMPNLLSQKFPAPAFKTTVKVKFQPLWEGEQFGLMIFGADYAYVGLQKEKNGITLNYYECIGATKTGRKPRPCRW